MEFWFFVVEESKLKYRAGVLSDIPRAIVAENAFWLSAR
jgi:hypothetical protein